MQERHVVTCFLLRRRPRGEEVLLLRRSEQVSTYRGRWAGVSGSLEPGEEPLARAYREIEEETGLGPSDLRLLRAGEPLAVEAPELDIRWMVHPFLFQVAGDAAPRLDWEHVEVCWVLPGAVPTFETVPMLTEALGRVWPAEED